jgi:hypothetical protein
MLQDWLNKRCYLTLVSYYYITYKTFTSQYDDMFQSLCGTHSTLKQENVSISYWNVMNRLRSQSKYCTVDYTGLKMSHVIVYLKFFNYVKQYNQNYKSRKLLIQDSICVK